MNNILYSLLFVIVYSAFLFGWYLLSIYPFKKKKDKKKKK